MAWICKSCGGKVNVDITQRFEITKDKKVRAFIGAKLGDKMFQRVTCENHCGWTEDVENLEKISKWVE